MLRRYLGFTLFALPLFSAQAAERFVYPGVILSNRGTPTNERLLEDSVKANRFFFLSSERLASGSVHVVDKRVKNEPFLSPKRPALCRTAKVRQIIKSARSHINCSANDELTTTVDPNDTSYSLLYAHSLMQSNKAWDISTGSDSLIAVIIDTGIDYNHSDLQANMWKNPSEIPNNKVDDDKNGYVDDVYGVNTITGTGNPLDDQGHGTHVAGIIGAVGNNARGVVGVNWRVKLAAAKFLSSAGTGSAANAIKAISYATELKKAGHKVIATNNSWGGGNYSKPLYDAIATASDAGVLFIAAAGNNSSDNDYTPTYPSSYAIPNIISVASLMNTGGLSSFSNYGWRSVHIAAPGSNIYSTVRNDGYAYKSGTSMAAPQVTGLALLTASACDKLDMAGIKTSILGFGTRTDILWRRVITSSMVNAGNTVAFAQKFCQDPTTAPLPPTPPPAPTPTPKPKASFVATPSRVSAGQNVSFKASSGAENVNYGSIDINLYGLDGTKYVCDYRNYMLLTKGTKTLTVKMPATAKHFASIEMTFTTTRGSSVAVLEILNTQSTLVPYSKADQSCKDFNGQFR